MAHLRGLKSERLFGRSYAEGVAEYVAFASELMRSKEIPDRLMSKVRARYETPGAAERARMLMDTYAWDTFQLTEQHLVRMVWSPFTAGGTGLADYLNAERPIGDTAPDRVQALLANEGASPPPLAAELARVSGLPLRLLRVLYRSPLRDLSGLSPNGLMGRILAGDPHKAVITTRHTPDGPEITELISGR